MGKTKTAFVPGVAEEEISGKAAYEAKRKIKEAKKEQEEKKKAQVSKVGLKGGERIKVVTGEIIPEVSAEVPSAVSPKASKPPKVRGKKYLQLKSKIDRNKLYPITEALRLVKETSYSKFDGTMEMHLVVKKQGLSERVTLPHQAGKVKRVEIADEKTIEKLKKGKIDFDVLLATADMMPKLVPFAKILGPKGLMPNPKTGTLIKDKSAESVAKSAESVVLKTEKEQPLIHTVVGKASQPDGELEENIAVILDALKKQVVKAYLKSTMSPSVKLQI